MSSIQNETDLYRILGLERAADKDSIRSAYKKLSMKHHPDRGGTDADFQALQRAYDVLSDDRKREIYNMTGSIEGDAPPQMNQGFQFNVNDLFGGMFGGGFGMPFGPGGPGGPTGQRVRHAKAPPKVHEIPLTLDDFYNGRTIPIKFERQKFCTGCSGLGCKNFVPCEPCGGRGFNEHIMQFAPGIQAMTRGPCGPCSGEGRRPGASCATCNGRKFRSDDKTIEIKIEPGMKVGEMLIFPSECSDHHDFMEPGDLHIVLQEADENTLFQRKDTTLHITIEMTLVDCLLGKTLTLQGHPGFPGGLVVEIPPGKMSGTTHVVEGKGMPKRGSQGFGTLECHITVNITDMERDRLEKQSVMIRTLFT